MAVNSYDTNSVYTVMVTKRHARFHVFALCCEPSHNFSS